MKNNSSVFARSIWLSPSSLYSASDLPGKYRLLFTEGPGLVFGTSSVEIGTSVSTEVLKYFMRIADGRSVRALALHQQTEQFPLKYRDIPNF